RRATAARAANANQHLTGGRHNAPRVIAVPDIDTLVTALVRAGADEPLQLLLEHSLDGHAHCSAYALLQVMLKVFLRREHGVDNVEAKRSFRFLHEKVSLVWQPGGSLVFSCRPRKRLLHNYRDTTRPPIRSTESAAGCTGRTCDRGWQVSRHP